MIRLEYEILNDLRVGELITPALMLSDESSYVVFAGKKRNLIAYLDKTHGECSFLDASNGFGPRRFEGFSWNYANGRHLAFWNPASKRIVVFIKRLDFRFLDIWAELLGDR